MMTQGVALMLVGMGTVYGFLYLLVALMRLIAIVVPRFEHLLPSSAAPAPNAGRAGRREREESDDGFMLAVAVAAAAARGKRPS